MTHEGTSNVPDNIICRTELLKETLAIKEAKRRLPKMAALQHDTLFSLYTTRQRIAALAQVRENNNTETKI